MTSDMFDWMGVIVYQWLSGTLPFANSSVHETAVPLQQRVPAISPAVEAVVMKALEQDPSQRFASVWKFAKALELAVNQPNLSAPTVLASPVVLATPTVQRGTHGSNPTERNWHAPAGLIVGITMHQGRHVPGLLIVYVWPLAEAMAW